MKITSKLWGAAIAALFLAGGCQTHPAPPAEYLGDSYSQREKSEADSLLKGITTLSLAQAQDIAIANNPSYIAAYYSIEAAKMRYYQALGAYSPTLTADVSAMGADDQYFRRTNQAMTSHNTTFTADASVTANLLIFNGFARYFSTKVAELGVEQQKALTQDDCRILIRTVAYAYNSLLLSVENMRIAKEDLDFQIKNLKDTELKFKTGAVSLSEVLNFRVQANDAESNYITAEDNYAVAIYALAVLMGYPEGTLPPQITFPALDKKIQSEIPGVDLFLDNALANRPDLKAYREQLKISEYQLYSSYSAYSPVLYATAAYNFGGMRGKNRERSTGAKYRTAYNQSNFYYGVNASWTIFNGLIRYNQVREAKALLAVSNYQVADAWLKVVQEVRNAHLAYVQNVKQSNLYQKSLEVTTKQRDLVEEEFNSGNTDITRLNEAQRDLVDAQTSLASAVINVHNAKAQLDAAAAMNVNDYTRAPAVFTNKAEEKVITKTPENKKKTVTPAPKSKSTKAAVNWNKKSIAI